MRWLAFTNRQFGGLSLWLSKKHPAFASWGFVLDHE
jgi:hypothetical protein